MKKTEVYKNDIKSVLDTDGKYRSFLFKRGYLVTDDKDINTDIYPFYSLWNKHTAGKYSIIVHNEQDYSQCSKEGITAVMIGHAYDPFLMKHDDKEILSDCLDAYLKGKDEYFDKINSISGMHLIMIFDKDDFTAVQDCGGMRSCYFGKANGNIYVTSHPQLVADLCDLKFDPDVELLFSKKFYTIGTRYMPGNLTPYIELKRLGANTYLDYSGNFKIVRFYPTRVIKEIKEKDFSKYIEEISRLLHNNIELCTRKWKKPAISLSGGTDSKTTLACANGLYDKFYYYSFHAKNQEKVDASAAKNLCDRIGVKHNTYPIPEENSELEDFDFLKKMLNHNTSYVSRPDDHEARKFIYMSRVNDFDVELKSWISEIGRAFWSRKYGLELPAKLHERHFSIFQKRYFGSPYLLRWADRVHRDFLKEIDLVNSPEGYEHQDMFYWEVRFASWGTMVESMHDFFNLVTMPFNNRKLMELFLLFPHDMRKSDTVHAMVIDKMNKEINDSGIAVHNKYLGGKRIIIEHVYYRWRTMFFRSKLK